MKQQTLKEYLDAADKAWEEHKQTERFKSAALTLGMTNWDHQAIRANWILSELRLVALMEPSEVPA